MNVYLTKWTCNDEVAYKIGISKYGAAKLVEERFGDRYGTKHQYDIFDIEVLGAIQFSSESFELARAAALGMEYILHSQCPKNFFLEEHFDLEEGILDGMGGITEFFLMPEDMSEEKLTDIFIDGNKFTWKLENKLKAFRGTRAAEMSI